MAVFCNHHKTESPEMPGYREVREWSSVPLTHLGPFVYGGQSGTRPLHKMGQLAHDHPEVEGFPTPEYLEPDYPQEYAACGKYFTSGKWIVLMAGTPYHVECYFCDKELETN